MTSPQLATAAKPLSYGIEAVCAETGICRSTVFALMASGELPSFKIGRRRLVSAAALEQFVRDKESAAVAERAAQLAAGLAEHQEPDA